MDAREMVVWIVALLLFAAVLVSPVACTVHRHHGMAAIGKVPPLPGSDELLAYWCARLNRPERMFLEFAVEQYPNAVTKEELSTATGYSITSSSFGNALGALRSLELIQRGEIKAADEFFNHRRAT